MTMSFRCQIERRHIKTDNKFKASILALDTSPHSIYFLTARTGLAMPRALCITLLPVLCTA